MSLTNTLFLILVLTTIGCNENKDRLAKSNVRHTAEELKFRLRIQENSAPREYLSVTDISMAKNIVREESFFHDAEYDGVLIKGYIKNSATLAKYKDIIISIRLISKTGSIIDQTDHTIYEFYEPNSSKAFSIKIYPPTGTAQFSASVKNAIPV